MATTALAAARFKLAYNRPYIAHAVWALIPTISPGLGTLAVDKYWRLYYDPEVEKMWNVDELMSVLYHEICHLLRQHPERGEGKAEPFDWNLAADAEINDDIREEKGFTLPGECIYPSVIGEEDGKIAEVYYEHIQQKKKQSGQGSGNQSGQSKQGNEQGSGSSGAGSGNCGSASGGTPSPAEQGPPSDAAPGLNPGEQEILGRQVAQEIEAASKSRGDVPGHLDRWAKEKLHEKVDWRKMLATYLRNCIAHTAGASDYTFKKMSRRNTADVILPATVQPIPNVAVVIDTSGSMSRHMVEMAVTEVGGILKANGARDGVTVLTVDAKVHAVKKVFKKDQIKLKGGGGTDMGLGIKGALELRPRPDIIVVITDGETPWPKAKPASRVIICLVSDPSYSKPPEWAKVVHVDE